LHKKSGEVAAKPDSQRADGRAGVVPLTNGYDFAKEPPP
jgi:hypothetical protein